MIFNLSSNSISFLRGVQGFGTVKLGLMLDGASSAMYGIKLVHSIRCHIFRQFDIFFHYKGKKEEKVK